MKNLFFAPLFVGLLWAMVGCQTSAGQTEEVLAPEAFAEKLKKTPDAQLLDVRTPQEFKEKHLAQAVNINANDAGFLETVGKQLDKKKPVFVYCLAGGRSTKAREALKAQGYQVYEMQGGLARWQSAKMPLDIPQNAPAKEGISLADFQTKVGKEKVVVVDFSAVWCKPCKQLKPMLEKLGKDMSTQLTVQFYDFDDNQEIAQHFNIESLPTMIVFKAGKEAGRIIGSFETEGLLKQEIEKYL